MSSTLLTVGCVLLIGLSTFVCISTSKSGQGVDQAPALYESIRDAVINEKKNLLALQELLYPSTSKAAKFVKIIVWSDDFTVGNISDNTTDSDSLGDPAAFKYNSSCDCYRRYKNYSIVCKKGVGGHPCQYGDIFYIGYGDASNSDPEASLTSYYSKISLYLFSIDLCMGIIFSGLVIVPPLDNGFQRTNITIFIDQLMKMLRSYNLH